MESWGDGERLEYTLLVLRRIRSEDLMCHRVTIAAHHRLGKLKFAKRVELKFNNNSKGNHVR